MEEFNQKKFRELLKKGIGLRTQKDFAEQAGIAPATLNRMLNDEQMTSRPRLKTIETLAEHMHSVKLSELMVACGYEAPDINEIVKSFENDISDYFAFAPANKLSIFGGLADFEKNFGNFLNSKRSTDKISINEGDSEPPAYVVEKGAENVAEVKIVWLYDKYECITRFDVYYTRTASDKVIIICSDIDSAEYGKHTEVRKNMRNTAEEKLLNAIFGTYISPQMPAVMVGYGFELNGIPDGFADFLYEHATTFCDSEANASLYKRYINGEKAEDVFSDYIARGSSGITAVIADIMAKESGLNYRYYEKSEELPDELCSECIMVPFENNIRKKIDKATLLYLYNCANKLKLPKFGVVYYRYVLTANDTQIYNTADFLA